MAVNRKRIGRNWRGINLRYRLKNIAPAEIAKLDALVKKIYTEEAIRASIRKWERNKRLAAKKEPLLLGVKNCPLCKLFFKAGCVGCPVMKKTGWWHCRQTPYQGLFKISRQCTQILMARCQWEIDFLSSMLPENKNNRYWTPALSHIKKGINDRLKLYPNGRYIRKADRV